MIQHVPNGYQYWRQWKKLTYRAEWEQIGEMLLWCDYHLSDFQFYYRHSTERTISFYFESDRDAASFLLWCPHTGELLPG